MRAHRGESDDLRLGTTALPRGSGSTNACKSVGAALTCDIDEFHDLVLSILENEDVEDWGSGEPSDSADDAAAQTGKCGIFVMVA